MTGNELKPTEIINGAGGPGGPSEIRYRAHVAFSTMNDALKNLEKVHNRRKALVWVSDGYDFTRSRTRATARWIRTRRSCRTTARGRAIRPPRRTPTGRQPIRAPIPTSASRCSRSSSPTRICRASWTKSRRRPTARTRRSTRSTRAAWSADGRSRRERRSAAVERVRAQVARTACATLAEETGGLAVVNTNDFDKALKRIDAETSDYYVLGYYSKNPDILRSGGGQVDVRVTRAGLSVCGAQGIRAQAAAGAGAIYEAVAFLGLSSPRRPRVALAGRLSAAARSSTASPRPRHRVRTDTFRRYPPR